MLCSIDSEDTLKKELLEYFVTGPGKLAMPVLLMFQEIAIL